MQILRKTDCHIQFAVKMYNASGRLGTYTHTHTHKLATIIFLVRIRQALISVILVFYSEALFVCLEA